MDSRVGSENRRELAQRLIRRQSALSLRLAAVFILALVGLPLLNLFAPEIARARIGGFTLSWLLLAVLFYPFTVLLSAIFVRGSDRIEREIARDVREPGTENRDQDGADRSPSPVPGSPVERSEDRP